MGVSQYLRNVWMMATEKISMYVEGSRYQYVHLGIYIDHRERITFGLTSNTVSDRKQNMQLAHLIRFGPPEFPDDHRTPVPISFPFLSKIIAACSVFTSDLQASQVTPSEETELGTLSEEWGAIEMKLYL